MASASLLIIKVKKSIDFPPHRCFFPSSYWFQLTEHLLKLERAKHVVYIPILCHSRETFSIVVLHCLAQVLPSARCHTKCEECSSHLWVFDSFTGVFAVQVYCMHASCRFSLNYSAWGETDLMWQPLTFWCWHNHRKMKPNKQTGYKTRSDCGSFSNSVHDQKSLRAI